MVTILSSAFLLLGLLQTVDPPQSAPAAPQASANQTAIPANSPTPTDAKELLDVGRKVNGLSGTDVQPWHLKASYETFDNEGNSKDKGAFEEWWISDQQYKRVYQSTSFSQTEYGTDHGIFRSGNPRWPLIEALVRHELVQPLPTESEENYANPETNDRTIGGIRLRCVAMKPKAPLPANAPPSAIPVYCFSAEKPILRLASTYSQVVLNHVQVFAGHYLAGDIEVSTGGKTTLKIHLDSAETVPSVDNALFVPPSDVVPAPPRRIAVSSGVMKDSLITRVEPNYPPTALANHIQGTVVLKAVISTTGLISSLYAITGPAELRDAALDAVRQWCYKPYLLNGELVEVMTQINVVFSLNK